MAFVREIGRNGALYSDIWPRHRVSNLIDISEISIAIKLINRKKKWISMTICSAHMTFLP